MSDDNHVTDQTSASPGKLVITDDCIRCRLCVEQCPEGALSIKKDSLTVGSSCRFCLSCLEVCPVDAIRFFRKDS